MREKNPNPLGGKDLTKVLKQPNRGGQSSLLLESAPTVGRRSKYPTSDAYGPKRTSLVPGEDWRGEPMALKFE